MKDLKQFRDKILTKKKLQLEIKNLRSSYIENPSNSIFEKLIEKTKTLAKLK